MKLLGWVGLVAVGMIAGGLSIPVWWDWFIAGASAPFPSLPSLSFAQGLGLAFMVKALSWVPSSFESKDDKDALEKAVALLAGFYLVLWGFALIYHAL